MGILQITLFGAVQATHDYWRTEVAMTREIQGLLAYLVIHRKRVHSREVLAGKFWEDSSEKKARGSLNTALWKLKKGLEPEGISPGTYLINTESGEVGFNKDSPYWLDVEEFENGIHQVLTYPFQKVEKARVLDLEDALELYTGDLLERFFDTWVLRERDKLENLYMRGLTYLLHYYSFHRNHDQAIAYGQQILGLDPLREDIHREMMRLYLANGQRALALRQYEVCRLALEEEFEIPPMDETQAVYAQIFGEEEPIRLAGLYGDETSFNQAVKQLKEASQTIDQVKKQIHITLRSIAKLQKAGSKSPTLTKL